MNETTPPDGKSSVPWPHGEHLTDTLDASMPPADAKASSAALDKTGDEWMESMRTTVRRNPLAAIATALTLGVVIARITR
jgi:hypothetical protein